MLLPALLLTAAAAGTNEPAVVPAPVARARSIAVVQIVRAAEIRNGRSDVAHQRRIVADPTGERRILLEFE